MYPGDPSTPGYPAYENATREDGANIPVIPSLPISWANAERLLEEIGNEGRLLNGKLSKTTVKLVNHGLFVLFLSICCVTDSSQWITRLHQSGM
jgi:N-acetylated-alpha-linked acidic dipeptidase